MYAKILRAAREFESREFELDNQFSSLKWDDFIFFYYLLCGIKDIHSVRDPHCPVSIHVCMNYNNSITE